MNWLVEAIRLVRMSGKAGWQLVWGLYHLSRLKSPIVSIFGGKGAWERGTYVEQASRFARTCVEHDISVLTGGGPGIMEAANCGAFHERKRLKKGRVHTLGISVKGLDVKHANPCARVIHVDRFFIRKWLLIRYSCGFVIFPGGIGTVDELFHTLNLIKLGRIKRVPIVLIDVAYWQPVMTWYRDHAIAKEFVRAELKDIVTITDDIDYAFNFLARSLGSSRHDA